MNINERSTPSVVGCQLNLLFSYYRISQCNIMSSSSNGCLNKAEETDDKPKVKTKKKMNARKRNSLLVKKRSKKETNLKSEAINVNRQRTTQSENGANIEEDEISSQSLMQEDDNAFMDLSSKTEDLGNEEDDRDLGNCAVSQAVVNGSDAASVTHQTVLNGSNTVSEFDKQVGIGIHSPNDGQENENNELPPHLNQPPMKRRKPMRMPYSEPVDLTCQVCGDTLPNATELTVHIRQHNSLTNSSIHSCNMCGRILSSQSSLDRHMLVHSGERPFKCPICKMAFTTNGNMNRHLRTHEKENEVVAATISIIQANSQSRQRKRIPSKRLLEQDDDYMPIKKKGLVKSPIKKQKSLISVPRETVEISLQAGDLSCPVCHKTFLCKYGVLTHMEMHPHMSLRCSICSAVFKNHKGLRVHIQMVHDKVLKQANTALPAGFQDLACLHVDFSSNSFPRVAQKWCEENARRCGSSRIKFVCKECNKAFPCRAALDLHAKTHIVKDVEKHDTVLKTEDVSNNQNQFLALFSLQPTASKAKPFIGNPAPSPRKTTNTSNNFIKTLPRKKPLQWHNFSKDSMELACIKSKSSAQLNPVKPVTILTQPGISRISPVKGSTISTSSNKLQPKVEESPQSFKKIKVKVEQSKDEIQVMDLSPNMTASTGDAGSAMEPEGIPEEAESEGVELSDLTVDPKFVDGDKKYVHTCKYCNKVFPFASTLKIHMRNHMGLTPYQCMLCTYASADKSTLVRHMRTHSGERPFSCGICEFPFTTKANCERHIRKKHQKDDKAEIETCIIANENPKSSTEASTFTTPESACTICARSFKFFRDLQNHMRVHEKCDDKPYICSRCPSGFASKSNCLRHIVKRHPEVRQEDLEAVMIIQEPKHNLSSENILDQPLDFSMKAEKPPAMISLASTSQILTSDSVIPRSNLLVPQSSIGKLRFKRVYHKFYSRAVDALVCPHCSLAFSRSALFKRHIRSHTAERPFRCYFCSAAFTVKENLDKHMQKRHDAIPDAPQQSFIPKVATPMQHKLFSKTPSKRPIKPREKPSARQWVDLNSTTKDEPPITFVQSFNPSPISSFESDPGEDLTSISKMLAATKTYNFQSLLEARLMNPPTVEIPLINVVPQIRLSEVGSNVEKTSREKYIEKPINQFHSQPENVDDKMKVTTKKDDDKKEGTDEDKKGRVRYKFVKKLSCPYCPRMFPWISSLRRHLLVHSGLKPYQCCNCTANFSTKSNCERHMVRKHNMTQDEATKLTTVNPFNCEICSKISFNRIDLLESHYNENHPNDSLPSYFARAKEVMQIPLEELMSKVKSKSEVNSQKKKHPQSEIVEMNEINKTDESLPIGESDLEKSNEMTDKEEELNLNNETEEDLGEVTDGGMESKAIEFDREIGIDIHVEQEDIGLSKGEESEMEIMANDKGGNQLDSERQAVESSVFDNGRKRRKVTCTHICKQCKKKFKNSATLRRHYRVHTLEHPFKCSICSSSFTTKFNCQRHMIKIHGKQREDVFKVMELSESEQNELIREATNQISASNHDGEEVEPEDAESIHSSNDTDHASSEKSYNSLVSKPVNSPGKQASEDLRRKFSCDVCQKKFLSSRDLKRHDRTHTGERPFVCTDCNRNFGFKHSLVRHQRTHGHSNWTLQKSAKTNVEYNETNTSVHTENLDPSTTSRHDDYDSLSNSQDIYIPSTLQHDNMLMSSTNDSDLFEDGESLMSRINESDIIKNLLGIQDSSMIDEMLDSADSAAKLLGV